MSDCHVALLLIVLSLMTGAAPLAGGSAPAEPFPKAAAGWRAEGASQTYDRATVYDYMDGGAEIYLEYGMRRLLVQRYAKEGESPIVFDLFEMDYPAGAYGAFTFEREDEEAGVGQGSEYGGGLLRFWQGRWFGFVQAEVESSASKEAVLALGKAVASVLGPDVAAPRLPEALPAEGLRPRSVRFVLSPLLLQIREPFLEGNPMGLPGRCEAVVARYGGKGNADRVVLARFSDPGSAGRGVESLLKERFPEGVKPGLPISQNGGWSCAKPVGTFVVVVLGSSTEAGAAERLREAEKKLGEVKP